MTVLQPLQMKEVQSNISSLARELVHIKARIAEMDERIDNVFLHLDAVVKALELVKGEEGGRVGKVPPRTL